MGARYNYKFTKSKSIVLFAFDYKCALCGAFSVSNHVHHRDSNFENNCAFNYVVLCPKCHKLAHKLHLNINLNYTKMQVEILNKLNSLF